MNKPSPDTLHPVFYTIKSKEELVTALYAGTEAMRDATTKYLPKEPKETDKNYLNRLARSVLFPAYKQSVQSNTGKLFINDLEVENSSPEMDDILLTVDQDDNDITEFSKTLAESAIHQGCSYILVDFPVMVENATLADEIAEGGRPYWVNIEQSQVLEASSITRNGKRILGVFRYKENVEERVNEFEVKFIEQIKQFSFNDAGNVFYTIYRKDKSGQWDVYDNGDLMGANTTPLTDIPVAAANVNPEGFYVGTPVFYDLAEENGQHWQMMSDYNNIVHHSQVPMIVVKGVTKSLDDNGQDNNQILISPNTVISLDNPEADVKWLEVTGDAAVVGRDAIKASEDRMAGMSLQLLSNSDAGATATASQIDAVESLSRLQSMGKTIEQAINKAIIFTYKYLGEDKETLISIDVQQAVDMSQDLSVNSTHTGASKASGDNVAD